MEDKNYWHVIYTKSRQEKILLEQLTEKGFEVYLPLVKRVSNWSDRKKIIEVPLFNSYVFVKGIIDQSELWNCRSFVKFLMFNNKLAVVKQDEIDILKSIIKHGYDLSESSEIADLTLGNKVMVIAGPLKGLIGNIVSNSNIDWFVLNFETIGNSLQVKIPPKSLKKI
jgi:transcription antitermination factor NusG